MVDGVRIIVPDSLNLITPYVLMEQQDWFEDEIKFVRCLLRPGQKLVDIGANYGVYTLSMAHAVGPSGQVWAFEPASTTRNLLAESVALNGFSQVVVVQSALSKNCGTAWLALRENAELNALIPQESSGGSEAVPVVTLDDCMGRYGWSAVDFIKIDAEGEETNILAGGKAFFSDLSPLVQYEVKAGAELQLTLVKDFAALGYDSYRLVPGLDLLIPFDDGSMPDPYLLNLFACKRECAQRLAARGLLLDSSCHSTDYENSLKEVANRSAYNWRHTIAKLPYGALLSNRWEQTVVAEDCSEVEQALALYAVSRDSALPTVQRFGALEASFGGFRRLCERQPSFLRSASLARVAREFGARAIAVNALQQLSNVILQTNRADVSEPFLAPGKRFDSVPPGNVIGNWVFAAILEEIERLASYSSFYTGISARQRLEAIRTLGYADAEMDRRLRLLQMRMRLHVS